MSILRLALTSVLLAAPFCGQTGAGNAGRSELDYFRFLFTGIANLRDKPADLELRRSTLVGQFQLNEAHAKALQAVAGEFRVALLQIEAATNSLLAASGGRLTNADRLRLSDLATKRDQTVLVLAERLKSQLGPEASERLLRPLKAPSH